MDIELPSRTPAFVVQAEHADRGLVIIPDIGGLRPLFTEMCHDVSARTGWSVATFEPFPGADFPPPEDPAALDARFAAMADLQDSVLLGDAVAAADVTGAESVGLIGFCMGGMYALKASGTGRFDRIVAFYGMITVPEAWAGEGQGQPLDALATRGEVEVLAVVGTEDIWTPSEQVDALDSAGVTVVRYEGAEHGFVHDPDRPAHRPDDAADAWDRAIGFLSG
jgi:carboxymethylenebutenolidase